MAWSWDYDDGESCFGGGVKLVIWNVTEGRFWIHVETDDHIYGVAELQDLIGQVSPLGFRVNYSSAPEISESPDTTPDTTKPRRKSAKGH
jgi:hypothetical protein